MNIVGRLGFVVVLLALAVPVMAQQPTDLYLMKIDGRMPADLAERVAAAGGTLYRTHPEIGIAVARSSDPAFADVVGSYADVSSAVQDYSVRWVPSVESFDLHSRSGPSTAGHIVPNPTTAAFYPCQWNMSQINAPGAWGQGEFGQGVKVAVLDTGTDPFHNDLAAAVDVANSRSFVSASPCGGLDVGMGAFIDFNFHGSFVSGLIAGTGLGITGVAPDAQIVGVKVLNCFGFGSFADIIAGILYAAQVPNVEVINMSLGAYFPKNLPGAGPLLAAVTKAVNFANSQGVLVVSAAGNNGANLDKDRNFVSLPAQAGAGIAAWAGDIDGNLAGYSNHGVSEVKLGAGGGANTPGSPQIPLPGCVLPAFGQDGIISICSTVLCGAPNFYLFNGTGTSFSSPIVAGVAALVDGKAGGSKNAGRLKSTLLRTADDLGSPGADNLYGKGRVNASSAVQK